MKTKIKKSNSYIFDTQFMINSFPLKVGCCEDYSDFTIKTISCFFKKSLNATSI